MFDFLRGRKESGAVPEVKASATGPLMAYTSGGRAAWSPRDAVSLTKTGFANNPVGFRVVKMIAEAAAAVPLVLQDDMERYDVHPLISLLTKPNPAQRQAEMFETLIGQLLLTGNAYIEAVGQLGEAPVELHVLRSDRMSVVPGRDGWPVAYDYTVSGRKHRFDASGEVSPLCHIKSFHPQDDHYGLSPM